MSKTNEAIREAHRRGYIVLDDGAVISPYGTIRSQRIRGNKKKDRYYYISMAFDKKSFPLPVHKLMAFQKYGEKMFENGICVRHLNGDSLDNAVGNIAIGTLSNNMMDQLPEKRLLHAKAASEKIMIKDWSKADFLRRCKLSYRNIHKLTNISTGALSNRYRGAYAPGNKNE